MAVENTKSPSDPTRQLEEELAMEMLCKPDDIVFSVPFATTGSIVPSVAFNLNEINITKNIGKVISEGAIMSRMNLYFSHLTNRDVYSLYPNNNITHSIIDLFTSW
jgi:hypothetical protein